MRPAAAARSRPAAGRVNCEPLPGSLCTWIVPPCASMILRVVGSPRPLPAGSRREEGVEDPGADLLGHPHAGVDHVEHDPRPVAPGRQDQLAAGGHGVFGVQDQVQEGLLEQVAIDADQRQVGARSECGSRSPWSPRVRLVEVAELVDDRVQVGRLELQVLHPGEPEEVLEDAVQPMDLVLQPLDPLQHAAVARGLGLLKVLGSRSRFSESVESGLRIS